MAVYMMILDPFESEILGQPVWKHNDEQVRKQAGQMLNNWLIILKAILPQKGQNKKIKLFAGRKRQEE